MFTAQFLTHFLFFFPPMSHSNKVLHSAHWRSLNERDVFHESNERRTAAVASLKSFILKNDDQLDVMGYSSAPE